MKNRIVKVLFGIEYGFVQEYAQEIKKKKDQSRRGMRDVQINPEKIGKIVDQRNEKKKNKGSLLQIYGSQEGSEGENGQENKLKGSHEGDVFDVEKI